MRSRWKYRVANLSVYVAWKILKDKCLNTESKEYLRYGAKGKKMAAEWIDDFDAFFLHIGKKPHRKMWLTLIDRNGDYVPGNVKWETSVKTNRNKSNNHIIEVFGEKMTISEAAEKAQISHSLVFGRIVKSQMNAEESLTLPVIHQKFMWQGKMTSLLDVSKQTGMNLSTLHNRLNRGMTIEQAVHNPMEKQTKYLYHGKMLLLSEISKQSGIKVGTLYFRIREKGMTIEQAASIPLSQGSRNFAA
jgi:hypothetical protein